MTAQPVRLSSRPATSRHIIGAVIVIVAVVLSAVLMIAGGVQRDPFINGSLPLLPEAPATVQVEAPASSVQVPPAPQPGVDIAPR